MIDKLIKYIEKEVWNNNLGMMTEIFALFLIAYYLFKLDNEETASK